MSLTTPPSVQKLQTAPHDKAKGSLKFGFYAVYDKVYRAEKMQRIECELKRLVETIAVGNASPTVMSAIAEREARLRVITDRIVEPGPDSLPEKLDELRTLAVSRLTQLRELLTNPSEIHEARALLAEQVGEFTLQRV